MRLVLEINSDSTMDVDTVAAHLSGVAQYLFKLHPSTTEANGIILNYDDEKVGSWSLSDDQAERV